MNAPTTAAAGVSRVTPSKAISAATSAGQPSSTRNPSGTIALGITVSYIDAPAAVRATFPEANPIIYLTSSLGITFAFMLILGVPLIYQITVFWQSILP